MDIGHLRENVNERGGILSGFQEQSNAERPLTPLKLLICAAMTLPYVTTIESPRVSDRITLRNDSHNVALKVDLVPA